MEDGGITTDVLNKAESSLYFHFAVVQFVRLLVVITQAIAIYEEIIHRYIPSKK
ncbi:Uncharacterised protein [Shigella sonnei]|nr:Uncharacterised protein [Shigella sonnei]